ncbi:hypothetical protein QQZ08_009725 [Neonectria magnoliae]|uniref:Methyltransferase n=1 Tax=Neonectria magnoliae TaxID=2732573 RepID=A0ABR1HLK0_9HYPO
MATADRLASMNFIADLPLYHSEKPYNCQSKDLPGGEITNLIFETNSGIVVQDVRGRQNEFTLKEHGFMFLDHESQVKAEVGSMDFIYQYLEETIALLKGQFQADKVICYDLRIRRNVAKEEVTGDKNDRATAMFAVQDVHVDQTLNGGYQRIKRHIRSDEVMHLSKDEWQALIMNVWRPLHHEVEDAPLAFCDYNSVNPDDLLEADRVYETYNGEIYYMKHNPAQKWYYLNHQKPSEVAIFTSFISDPGEDAKFCPHVSFQDKTAPAGCHKRESVEVRAIILRRKRSDV